MSIKTNESTNQTLYVLKKINSENLKVLGEDYQRDINENRVLLLRSAKLEKNRFALLFFIYNKDENKG